MLGTNHTDAMFQEWTFDLYFIFFYLSFYPIQIPLLKVESTQDSGLGILHTEAIISRMPVAVFQSVTCCKWKNFMMSYIAALPKPSDGDGLSGNAEGLECESMLVMMMILPFSCTTLCIYFRSSCQTPTNNLLLVLECCLLTLHVPPPPSYGNILITP